MNSHTPSDHNPYRSNLQDQIQEMIHSGRILKYPNGTDTLTDNPVRCLLNLPQIDGKESDLFVKSAEILTARTARHLDPGLIPSLANTLSKAELIILCSSAGPFDLKLGVTKHDEDLGFTYTRTSPQSA